LIGWWVGLRRRPLVKTRSRNGFRQNCKDALLAAMSIKARKEESPKEKFVSVGQRLELQLRFWRYSANIWKLGRNRFINLNIRYAAFSDKISCLTLSFFSPILAACGLLAICNSLLELTDMSTTSSGEIKYDNEAPYSLQTHAITNITWNASTRAFFTRKMQRKWSGVPT
jgi:hypothetical protein